MTTSQADRPPGQVAAPASSSPRRTAPVDQDSDLHLILAAWQEATDRLQQTHVTLCEEVCRLTAELERKNIELARKNRLADLGQMASHVAHEVRNGLAPVAMYLSLLRRRLAEDAAALDILEKLDVGCQVLEATVSDLLSFTSDRPPRRTTFPVGGLIADVCDALAPQFTAQGIGLRIDAPAELLIDADREMLWRALLNLMLNALDAMPDGGELVLTACQAERGVELEVADTGPGIPLDCLNQVCEPFFTTKSGGTGLGLAIVTRMLEAHGGDLEPRNCPEGGAAFTLRIPDTHRKAAA